MKRRIYKKIINKTNLTARSITVYTQLAIPFATVGVVIGLILYIFLTSLTVWNANKRTFYEKEVSQKSAKIIDLESKLSSINKNITPNLALSRGFIETHKVKYVNTKPLTTASRSNEMEL